MKRTRRPALVASRVGLVLLGFLLLAGAGAGGLLATRAVDRFNRYADGDEPVLNPSTRSLLADHAGAFQVGAGSVAAVLVLIGLLWLARQLPPVRRRDDRDIDLGPAPAPTGADSDPDAAHHGRAAAGVEPGATPLPPGRTTIAGSALVRALEADLVAGGVGIQRARVDYRHDGRSPDELRLRLDIDPACSVGDVVGGPVTAAVERFTAVAGIDPPPTVLTDLRLTVPDRPRVA